jgi:6-phosphogluconate dehydrogenase
MNTKPTLAIFGLGRMGGQIARRLHKNGFKVLAWNRSPEPVVEFKKFGGFASNDIVEIIGQLDNSKQPRIFWIMLPHDIVDDFLFDKKYLGPYLKKGDIVIDGGNSFYKDSMKRSAKLKKKGIYFF